MPAGSLSSQLCTTSATWISCPAQLCGAAGIVVALAAGPIAAAKRCAMCPMPFCSSGGTASSAPEARMRQGTSFMCANSTWVREGRAAVGGQRAVREGDSSAWTAVVLPLQAATGACHDHCTKQNLSRHVCTSFEPDTFTCAPLEEAWTLCQEGSLHHGMHCNVSTSNQLRCSVSAL